MYGIIKTVNTIGKGKVKLFFVSNMGDNKLFLNKGDLKFEDVSKKANISGNSSW